MKLARTSRFVRDFQSLPTDIQRRAAKQLQLLLDNPRHPSLRIKKMEGSQDIWEGRISKGGEVKRAYIFTVPQSRAEDFDAFLSALEELCNAHEVEHDEISKYAEANPHKEEEAEKHAKVWVGTITDDMDTIVTVATDRDLLIEKVYHDYVERAWSDLFADLEDDDGNPIVPPPIPSSPEDAVTAYFLRAGEALGERFDCGGYEVFSGLPDGCGV